MLSISLSNRNGARHEENLNGYGILYIQSCKLLSAMQYSYSTKLFFLLIVLAVGHTREPFSELNFFMMW